MSEDGQFLYIVSGSFLTFKAVNGFLASKSSKGDETSNWHFVNTATSFVHSTIVGLWALLLVLVNHQNLKWALGDNSGNSSENQPVGGHALICVTLGYFIFDAYDLSANTFHKFSTKALLLHHLAVSSSFALGAILQTYLFELAVALLTEVNSIFLHLRTLLKVTGGIDIKTTSSYRLVALANIATFFTCRILVFLWLGLRLLVMKTSLAPAIYVMFWSGLAIVAIISVIHFRRLIISDFFTPTSFSNGVCRKDKTS